jgi:hypothetical protein
MHFLIYPFSCTGWPDEEEEERYNVFLVYKCKLAYNINLENQDSCKEPFTAYARKNSKRLLRGFFYTGIRTRQKVGMVITSKRQGNGNVRKIKVEGDKGQEVTVCCEAVPQKQEKSTFRWFEQFAVQWSETFLTKKRKKHPKRENGHENLCRQLITRSNRRSNSGGLCILRRGNLSKSY